MILKLSPFKETFIFFLVILSLGTVSLAQKSAVKFSTEADIKEDLNSNVCKSSEERLEAARQLFKKMGAADDEIKIEKIKDVENLVVTKKGKTSETVIVGGHYDKTNDGCGAIDNWTGIVIVANLYRTIKQFDTQKTYLFVGFGKEELGLLGSDEMARSIPKEKRADYCAMVNLDSFGFAFPQVMTNISDSKLTDLAKEVSTELKFPFGKAAIEFASSDSESFRNQKIPAISIHGLSDKWKDYLHSSKDKLENVNVQSVHVGYHHALRLMAKIEASGCAAFRK